MSGEPQGLAIVQARASSSRLPRKVIKEMAGRPMLGLLLERLGQVIEAGDCCIRTVLATSTDSSDDPVADFGDDVGFPVVRGPLEDVLGRFVTAIGSFEPDFVLRLTGDNPMVNGRAVETIAHQYLKELPQDCVGVSNTLPEHRIAPYGFALEAVEADALRKLSSRDLSLEDREHVTRGLIEEGKIAPTELLGQLRQDGTGRENGEGGDISGLRWTVDYPEDFQYMERLFEALGVDTSVQSAIEWCLENPHPGAD